MKREQFVEGGAQRVDVGAVVERPAPAQGLLGAHVAQRADHVAGQRQLAVARDLGQAEVGDPQVAAHVHQQVARLDVAVDDAQPVGVLQRRRRVQAHLGHRAEVRRALHRAQGRPRRPLPAGLRAHHLGAGVGDGGVRVERRRPALGGPGQGSAEVPRGRLGPPPQPLDHLGQGLALDELHGVVVDALVAADRVDGHDVGVVQLGRRLRLVLEALQLPGVERRGERQDLQGDPPGQRDLLGLVDDPHAAAADLADDPVVPQPAAPFRHARPGRPAGGLLGALRVGQGARGLQRGQGPAQHGGKGRVAAGVLLDRRPLAAAEALRVVVEHLAEEGRQGVVGRGWGAHGSCPAAAPGKRTWCSRSTARP